MAATELKRVFDDHHNRKTPTSPELKEWWDSGERVGAQTTRTTLRVLAAVSALAASLIAVAALPTAMAPGPGPVRVSVAATLGALAPVLALAGSWRYGAVKADFLRRYQRRKIYSAIDAITTDHELQTVIRLNQARMDAYHELTLTQAARAYRNTEVAMAIGFLILVAGAAGTLTVAGGATRQVVVGALAVVGTALSGYIVATFLRAQQEAIGQLNVYFKQPLTTSYLLTAERWALKLPEESRPSTLAGMADQVVAQAFGSPVRADSHHILPRFPTGHGPLAMEAVSEELAAVAARLGRQVPATNGGSVAHRTLDD